MEEGPAARGQAPGQTPFTLDERISNGQVVCNPETQQTLLFFQDHLAEYFLGS